MSISNLRTLASISILALTACGDLGGFPNGPDANPPVEGGPDAGAVDPGDSRVTAGLQALYRFDQGSGAVVRDVSGVGSPLDLYVQDPGSVQWIAGGGLEVLAPTLIATPLSADKVGYACQASNAVTIEAWVRPAAVNQTGPARIVTFSDTNNTRNFTLGQEELLADVRLRTTETDDNGTPSTRSDITAFDGSVIHLAYTRGGLDDEAQIWLNGQLAGTETLAGNFGNWDMSYRFAVANELNGERPWRGEIYLVAVYCRDLSPAEVWQNYSAGY